MSKRRKAREYGLFGPSWRACGVLLTQAPPAIIPETANQFVRLRAYRARSASSSHANRQPVRPIPDMIASTVGSTPLLSHAARVMFRSTAERTACERRILERRNSQQGFTERGHGIRQSAASWAVRPRARMPDTQEPVRVRETASHFSDWLNLNFVLVPLKIPPRSMKIPNLIGVRHICPSIRRHFAGKSP